jgi:hypothetical protein
MNSFIKGITFLQQKHQVARPNGRTIIGISATIGAFLFPKSEPIQLCWVYWQLHNSGQFFLDKMHYFNYFMDTTINGTTRKKT